MSGGREEGELEARPPSPCCPRRPPPSIQLSTLFLRSINPSRRSDLPRHAYDSLLASVVVPGELSPCPLCPNPAAARHLATTRHRLSARTSAMSDPEPASPTFADRRAGSLATEMELDRAEEELRQARRRRVLTRPAEVVVAHDSDSDVSVEEDPLTTIPQRVATRPPARPRPVRAQRSSSSYGVDATPPKTFTTRNLPPAIAEIATHPGWLHTQVQSGKLIGYTGLQIIQDSNLFPGSRPTKQDEPFGPLTAGTPPGSSVRCGRLPVETSSSQPSLLLPNARFSSASSMGCSGVLAGPTDRIFSLSIDFLLVTETETSVEHSYVREPRWMYPSRVSKAAVVMTDDPMERRGLGCGCETRRIDCQGWSVTRLVWSHPGLVFCALNIRRQTFLLLL